MKVENPSSDVFAFELQREPQMNGELDAVLDIIAEHTGCNVILDFTRVDIITSSSLTKLLKLRQAVLGAGRHLIFCSIHPFTKSAFEVTGLDGVFELARDMPAAMAVVRSGCLAGSQT
jgi:anti-anti-sigma factor